MDQILTTLVIQTPAILVALATLIAALSSRRKNSAENLQIKELTEQAVEQVHETKQLTEQAVEQTNGTRHSLLERLAKLEAEMKILLTKTP